MISGSTSIFFLGLSVTDLRLGCNVAGTEINLLCFSDDRALLAPSWNGLETLIDKLNQAAI